jgi:hypothetical protein
VGRLDVDELADHDVAVVVDAAEAATGPQVDLGLTDHPVRQAARLR